MSRIAIPTVRPSRGTLVTVPAGAFANHVLGWPDGPVGEPNPFSINVAADLRKFPRWPQHEPTQGNFVWLSNNVADANHPYPGWMYDAAHGYYSNADLAVTQWHGAGKKILLVLDPLYAPAWTNINDDAAFAAWVTAAVTRWQPEAVEFSNEPSSIATDIPWLVNKYAVGRAAAKAVKPDILIVGPSCESITNGGNGITYTANFLSAGGAALIDVLGVHLYPHGPIPNHAPMNLIQQIDDLHAGIDSLWGGPIWNTENGCSPELFNVQTKTVQLQWFWQHNLLPIVKGLQKTFFFAFGEDNYGPYPSPYLTDIIAMWQIIKSLEGGKVWWKRLVDDRLLVVRRDGAEFVY